MTCKQSQEKIDGFNILVVSKLIHDAEFIKFSQSYNKDISEYIRYESHLDIKNSLKDRGKLRGNVIIGSILEMFL